MAARAIWQTTMFTRLTDPTDLHTYPRQRRDSLASLDRRVGSGVPGASPPIKGHARISALALEDIDICTCPGDSLWCPN